MVDALKLKIEKLHLTEIKERILLNARKISESMVGTIQEVLVSGAAVKDPQQMSGRTENNRIVNFIGGPELIGKMVSIEIKEALRNSLRGIRVET